MAGTARVSLLALLAGSICMSPVTMCAAESDTEKEPPSRTASPEPTPPPTMEPTVMTEAPTPSPLPSGTPSPTFGISNTSREVTTTTFQPYPGYNGKWTVTGRATVRIGHGDLAIVGQLWGLEPSSSGGIYVHEGTSCDDVGDHFMPEGIEDRWNSTWSSDSTGFAKMDAHIVPWYVNVEGQVVVVYLSDGTPAACGKLYSFKELATATLGNYPGYNGPVTITGKVLIEVDSDGLRMIGGIIGPREGASGGIHVHEGFSCEDAGGHYNNYKGVDTWLASRWSLRGSGSWDVTTKIEDWWLPVSGHAVVAHLADGTRAACGVASAIL